MPAKAVLDEDIWKKAKKAAGKSYDPDSDPDAFYGTTMVIYKNMGGRLKGHKQADPAGNMPKPAVGIKTYWSWITPDKMNKQSGDDDKSQGAMPPEVQDAIVQNPKMSAATLINWLKSKGFEIKKKV